MKKIILLLLVLCLILSCKKSKELETTTTTYQDIIKKYFKTNIKQKEDKVSDKDLLLNAVINGDIETTKILINKGLSVNTKDVVGQTLLFRSSENGHFNIVQFLIENEANSDGVFNKPSPLMGASSKGYLNIVKYLINNGANINKSTEWGSSVSYASNYEILEYLIDHGATKSTILSSHIMVGWTALHNAAVRNDIPSIKLLIENGININEMGNQEETPLNLAIQNGHFESVKELVKQGADIHLISADGVNAIDYSEGKEDIHHYLSELSKSQ